MNSILQDICYGLRTLARKPTFALVIVATIALGIGINTTVFTVINGVLLKPLPFEEPDRLFVVEQSLLSRHGGREQAEISLPELNDLRACDDLFSAIAGVDYASYNLTGAGYPERVEGAIVTVGFFQTLGVKPLIGRLLEASEDGSNLPDEIVLTHRFWVSHLAGRSEAIGQTLTLDGVEYTIVGVLPATFRFPLKVSGAQVFTPLSRQFTEYNQRFMHFLTTIGRLKPGVKPDQAQARIAVSAAQLAQAYPEVSSGCALRLRSLHDKVIGNTRSLLYLLLGAIVLVLLIACANAANLHLVRGMDRRQELALRAALGAGRGRLFRQLLTESVLLALAGGLLGTMLAVWGTDFLVTLLPRDLPRRDEISVDGRVLSFAFGLSILTGLLFGLPSALYGVRKDLHATLKQGGIRVGTTRSRRRIQSGLVVFETALTLLLLIGSGLLMRSFARLTNVDAGFIHENILTFRVLLDSAYGEPVRLREAAMARLSALPGVLSVGTSDGRLLAEDGWTTTFEFLDCPKIDPSDRTASRFCGINLDYFSTLGIPLLRGRLFTDQDTRAAPEGPGVVIINETMARRFPPGTDPIGQRIREYIRFGKADPTFEVIGIVRDVHDKGLDIDPRPYMYVPYTRHPGPYVTFALRTNGDPTGIIDAVRSELATLLPGQAPYAFTTLDQLLGDSMAARRCPTILLSFFSITALILSAVGIYGMFSYSVSQQTHEIGIRMALGAQQRDVLADILGQGLTLTGIGLGIGLGLSAATTRFMASLLYGVGTIDPITFLGVPLLLGGVALIACFIPARRAAGVDPLTALRCE